MTFIRPQVASMLRSRRILSSGQDYLTFDNFGVKQNESQFRTYFAIANCPIPSGGNLFAVEYFSSTAVWMILRHDVTSWACKTKARIGTPQISRSKTAALLFLEQVYWQPLVRTASTCILWDWCFWTDLACANHKMFMGTWHSWISDYRCSSLFNQQQTSAGRCNTHASSWAVITDTLVHDSKSSTLQHQCHLEVLHVQQIQSKAFITLITIEFLSALNTLLLSKCEQCRLGIIACRIIQHPIGTSPHTHVDANWAYIKDFK